MFGYVKAFKGYMRMFEYDIYKAVYCGLCKDMGRRYGFFTRFTLSYDLAFLTLVDMSLNNKKLKAEKQRCIAHPFKKTLCGCHSADYEYSSSAAVILTYHKLKDDMYDKGLKNKIAAICLMPFFRTAYKKAAGCYPKLAASIEKDMKMQRYNEKNHDKINFDKACEPTAKMMSAVFSELTEDKNKKNHLKRFGYFLGRFVYITDAADDLEDDIKNGNYNPLMIVMDNDFENIQKAYDFADMSINLSLGELAESYVKLDFGLYRDILDNIIYLGLRNAYENCKRKDNKNEKQKCV